MKPPTLVQWLIGNSVVSIALMLIGIAAVIGGLTGQIHWFLAILAVGVGLSAHRAAERVSAYQSWQREWQGMSGAPRATGSLRWAVARYAIGGLLWLIGAGWALGGGDGSDPLRAIASVLFWIGTVVMIAAPIWRRLRGRALARKEFQAVAVCLAIPRRSPSVAEAMRAVSTDARR